MSKDLIVHFRTDSISVAAVPTDHPMFPMFAMSVINLCNGIGTHRVTLAGDGMHGAELPEDEMCAGSRGRLSWYEDYPTMNDAMARAVELAPMVTVKGMTVTEALNTVVMTDKGVWAP